MHSVEELGTNVPAFLAKLWKMVEDPGTNDLICWSPNGSSFHICDQARFARELLPLYYKHNNMASFVRQLNMYGFHKVVSIDSGGLKVDRDDMEFAHQCFLMGHPYLLEHIKRKIPTNKSDDSRTGTKPEYVNKVLSEVKTLKGRQDGVDSQLSAMKRENEVLWREIAILRQKHLKQQQIVNKLIQFLVSMVQTSRGGGIGIKRHYPLMLNDITHHSNKSSKLNGNISDSVSSNLSPTGPVIHELDTAELLDDCEPSMDDETTATVFDLSDAVSPITSDLRDSTVDIASSDRASAPSAMVTSTNETNANVSTVPDSSPDILLELAEDCPLNSNVVLVPQPQNYLGNIKESKGKQKSSVFKGAKRRKSKLMPTMSKNPNQIITIKTERKDLDEPVNVNNFLEIMLPSLVDDNPMRSQDATGDSFEESILPDLGEEYVESNDKNQQSSLEAATDAAISAINSVAAQAAAAATEIDKQTSSANAAKKNAQSGEMSPLDACGRKISDVSSKDLTLACAAPTDRSFNSKEDLDVHLDSMQSELDTLKELLKGEGYNLDANMLLGLFGDEALSYGIPLVEEDSGKNRKQNGVSDPMVSGSELMTYSSNLLDLADMTGLDDWEAPIGSDGFSNEPSENTSSSVNVSPGFSGIGGKRKKK